MGRRISYVVEAVAKRLEPSVPKVRWRRNAMLASFARCFRAESEICMAPRIAHYFRGEIAHCGWRGLITHGENVNNVRGDRLQQFNQGVGGSNVPAIFFKSDMMAR